MSLVLTRDSIRTDLADLLGIGRSVPTDATYDARINAAIDSGLRNFYNRHDWSFLHPLSTLQTVADQGDYTMNATFGGIDGEVTYAPNEGNASIKVVSDQFILNRRQTQVGTGRPLYIGEQVLASDGSGEQTYKLMLWPTPNAVYNLTFRAYVHPNALTSGNPYPIGGAEHAETILAACRAALEGMFMEERGSWNGPENQRYERLVLASIEADRSRHAPEFLGLNLDYSDLPLAPTLRGDVLPGFTVNGNVIQ